MVGNVYFDVMETPCFVFEPVKVCTQRSWWGRCEEYGRQARATMHEPLSYQWHSARCCNVIHIHSGYQQRPKLLQWKLVIKVGSQNSHWHRWTIILLEWIVSSCTLHAGCRYCSVKCIVKVWVLHNYEFSLFCIKNVAQSLLVDRPCVPGSTKSRRICERHFPPPPFLNTPLSWVKLNT